MTIDWRGFACGLLMAIGGAMAGYGAGHWQGQRDSDSAAIKGVVDHCFIADPPAFCWAMLDALNGTYAEPSTIDTLCQPSRIDEPCKPVEDSP